MKFGSSVADIFIIKHTQFGWDAFGFDISNSIGHCLGLQFFRGHSVERDLFCRSSISDYRLRKIHFDSVW